MTVKELIERLQQMPQGDVVYLIEPGGECYRVEVVTRNHGVNLSTNYGCHV